MLSLKFVRENPEIVKQNAKNRLQDSKLGLVDEIIKLDAKSRTVKTEADNIKAERNRLSKQIGALIAQGKKEGAEEVEKLVTADTERPAVPEAQEKELEERVRKAMMTIPNIVGPSAPIGRDDGESMEVGHYGEPVVPNLEIPYYTEIMESFNGIDLGNARKVAGNGFYYLMGDIARLRSAVISYARGFMIDGGFTYYVLPFTIRSEVVTGAMSSIEMGAMAYKIEGKSLYLVGTSEHSMIDRFTDTIPPEESLPKTLTSCPPCFRKERGTHGLEERGVYRVHQFEKQEMIVVYRPEESPMQCNELQ